MRSITKHYFNTCIGLLFCFPQLSWAADAILDPANTAWVLTSTALVLFMTLPGLSLFYGGLVRSKNVLSVLMQCGAITALVSVLWLFGLYSLAFSEGNSFIGGVSKLFFSGMSKTTLYNNIPESVFAMFQLTFAIITPALIVGGFAERMKFSAVLLFSGLWVIFVYTPIAHWVWGGGWLQTRGLLDFAGGTVVHITAGVSALVAALVMGPRRGFPETALMPHNMTMTVSGAGMLWVGWYGFNGGSALAANGDAGMAILVTHISAATAALVWMSLEWFKYGKPSVLGIVTGMVAGLGTVTGASGYIGPAGSFIVGLLAGSVCFLATNFLKRKLKVDDSLDVFPVHGVGGMLGTLSAGILASPNLGLFSGSGFGSGIQSISAQLSVQFLGVLATVTYTAVLTWGILKIVQLLVGLRVTQEEETQGLDITQHEERGYDYL